MDKNSAIQLVMQDLQALAVYVRGHLSRPGVSTHTIANNAGGGISHGSVWNIANARVSYVKESTLAALAKGLGVSLEEVQAVVKGKPLKYDDPFASLKVLFHGWESASETDRREVMGAIRLIGEGFQQRLRGKAKKGGGKVSVREVRPGRDKNRGRNAGSGGNG
jgi:hypothetical protein